MTLSTKKRAVLVKLETVYNTDSVPTATADGVLMADLSLTPIESESATRSLVRAGYGGFNETITTRYGKLEIKVEMAGFGTAGPATPTASYNALLEICGLAGVVTATTKWDYTPISTAIKSATVYCYVDGRLHKFTGCRANLKMEGTSNEYPYYTFEVWGNYVAVADATLVSPTLTAFQTPVPFTRTSTTLASLLGVANGVCLESFSIDLGNKIVPPTGRINCPDEIVIIDRATVGNVTVEGTTVAVKDWWTNVLASTQNNTLDFTHGSVVGNRVQISSARMQIKPPTLSDDDNVEMLSFDTIFAPSVPGDELKITIL